MEKKTTKNTRPFRQLYADEHNELFQRLLKDPLLLAVYILCAIRARRVKEISPDGLAQFEFWLAQTEYAKFGLKPSQHSAIARKLQILINLKLISKSGKRLSNDGASVYRFISGEIISINPEMGNELSKERVTSEQRVSRNNNDKNVKNDNSSPASPKGSQIKVSGKERKQTKFPKTWYDSIIEEYQSLKGITLQGSEFKPIQQTIKSMFMDGRTHEQVIEAMRWVAEQGYTDWSIRTVKLKLPEVLPRLGITENSTPQSPQDQALVEKALREMGGGGNG